MRACDKTKAVAELLKDFSVDKTFRIAGRQRERIPAALPDTATVVPGLPRSALTEIWGSQSCGKTSLMHTFLAQATRNEPCALIDAGNSFDPVSASRCGIDLERLLWVKCGGRIETALKATDILLQGAGFCVTALDLGDMSPAALRKIPMMYWHRFRRAVESTPAAFLVVAPFHITGSCAAMVLAGTAGSAHWSGTRQFRILQTLRPSFHITRSENFDSETGFSVELRNVSGGSM